MKGLQIFTHSLRQVTGNLPAAIKVSGVLYIAQFILAQLLQSSMGDPMQMPMEMEATGGGVVMALLGFLVTIVTSVWIAVGWHRYVLREEQPGIVPPFLGDRLLGYFGKSLLIGLMMIPLAMVLGVVAGFIATPFVSNGSILMTMIVVGLIVYLPVGVVALRLSTILPGVALEPGQQIGAGWSATKGETPNFIVLVILSLIMALILNLPLFYVFPFGSILSLVWTFIVGWFITMVGVSILTTLYGHYIEKRALL